MKKQEAGLTRRDSLKYITLGTISVTYLAGCSSPEEVEEKMHAIHQGGYELSERDKELLSQTFFTDDERETARQLANLIIPADGRSGSAEDAGVIPFIEFIMLDRPENQSDMRGGLRWLNLESVERFEKPFHKIEGSQQRQILDDIAYPDTADPQFSHGVAFFNSFRDLVATGFWSSKMGMEDLPFMGNVATVWQGAPQEWLDKLGVSYS